MISHGAIRTKGHRLTAAATHIQMVETQRHPGLGEEPAKKPEPPKQLDLLGLDSDDTDTIADKHAMDRAGATGTLIRAHAINQGRSADMLPDF